MDKDAANLKNWLITVGLDINDTSDEMVKKLIPPQRRDMWRNIIKHVKPKEEVDLIKKSLLLNKLKNLQKPLMAKVESDEDLANALKYEQLFTKYNKIQKEINEVKIKNEIIQKDVDEKNLVKEKLKREIEFSTNKSYLAEQKTGYYYKFYKVINGLCELCVHFTLDPNTDLTKADYEDSLIKCFAVVDDAKQAGTMNDSVNLGKDLCNEFFRTIMDKSPAILVETIEANANTHINGSSKIIKSLQETDDFDYAAREASFKEFFLKLLRKQMEMKSKHSASLAEKNLLAQKLVEASRSIKSDIISRFELQNISRCPQQLQKFRTNISETFEIVIKNCLDCTKIVGWPEKFDVDETFKKLDEIFETTTVLNDDIEHKRLAACVMLKELNEKRNDFGLAEINTAMEKIAEDYSKKVAGIDEMKKLIYTMKRSAINDVDNIHKPITKLAIKPEAHKFRTLGEIAEHIESIDVFGVLRKRFEEFNNIICAENNFDEIEKKETAHKAEFEALITQMRSQLAILNNTVEDCNLVADVLAKKKPEK